MINSKSFTKAWITSFKKQTAHKGIDEGILEKMIYALHLLEHLQINHLDFVFKGGTSLILLLNQGNRFSIDIDIICNADQTSIEAVLDKVIETSNFTSHSLNENRSYKPGVPKAHYAFDYESVFDDKYSGKILLDILLEDSLYPAHTQKPVQAKWITTTNETLVTVPTIDAITGDKLTAFAPNMIGIPYFKGTDSFAMEICKQLFDLSKLFDQIEDIEIVAKSFEAFAQQEIGYRNKNNALTPEMVLQDTLDTCLIITKRGAKSGSEDQEKFKLLQKGTQAFAGFLITGKFRIDEAIVAAACVAHLAAKLLKNDLSPIQHYTGQDVKKMTIENVDWNFLNKLKKQPDQSSFFYWHYTVALLTKED